MCRIVFIQEKYIFITFDFFIRCRYFKPSESKLKNLFILHDMDGLMQERHNSIANTLELRLSCINPSI